MQKISTEHIKHSLVIQIPPLHKPQKKKRKKGIKNYSHIWYQNKCDYVNVYTYIHTIICSMLR